MEAGTGLVDNLAALATLDEKSLIEELRIRYKRDIIYTYIGDILIAFNPYQPLPIYGPEMMMRYTDVRVMAQNKPHLFAISDACFQNLRRTGTSQCCVVSGESGAGKTESTKLLVQHIAHLCRTDSSTLHQKIIQVNPLLEAFGNAQTVMNNNSSRFGKYIELLFDADLTLQGAKISEYVLEKSRVVSQGPGERNFHIFYYLFAGVDSAQLQNNLLNRPENHRILHPADGSPIYLHEADYSFHRDMWNRLTAIMDTVGFLQEEMNGILAILAAILMLTDITFLEDPDIGGVYIRDEVMLEMAAELLGVTPEELAAALISSVHHVRGERFVTLKDIAQANDGRDALAKSLYGRLFGWIVRQVNLMLQPHSVTKGPRIGILDIAGFENFTSNSFEQLCINAANEQLQFYFNQHIFQWELDEYKREGVKGKDVKFNDNRPLVDLFLEAHVGLFAILDEESRFPQGNEMSFIEKLTKTLGKKSQYSRGKGQSLNFTIQHYAGPVVYNVTGFLEKNRDHLSWNLMDCMKNSEAQFVCDLFFAPISDTGSLMRNADVPTRSRKSVLLCKAPDLSRTNMRSLSKQAGNRLKRDVRNNTRDETYINTVRTLSSAFKNSLTELMAKLLEAEPHFVRCIKSNTQKAPCSYQADLVKDQLRYTGVLETVKIRRQGYATRLPHHVFINRYKFICFPLSAEVSPVGSNCARIIKAAALKDAEIGKTKVFLKYWHPEQLQLLLTRLARHVLTAQRIVRGFLARRKTGALLRRAADQRIVLESFCHLVAKSCEDKHFIQERLAAEDEQRVLRKAQQKQEDIRQAQRQLYGETRLTAEERRKKGLYQATPIILGNPVFGNPNPVTLNPNRVSQRALSPGRERHLSPGRERGFSPNRQRGFSPERAPGIERGRAGGGDVVRVHSNGSHHGSVGALSGSQAIYTSARDSAQYSGSPYTPYTEDPYNSSPYNRDSYNTAPSLNVVPPVGGGYRNNSLPRQELPLPPGRGPRGTLTPVQDYEYQTSSLQRQTPYEYTESNTAHYARSPLIPTTQSSAFGMNLLEETLDRFSELDQEIWAKLFYMEKADVLAKIYLREKTVIVDESKQQFDGKVIGLKAFATKNSDVTKIIKKVGKGVKLTRDGNGNIFAERLSEGDIIMKGYKNPESACYPQEIIEHMGRLPKHKPMKIFCMQEYKSHIALQLQQPSIDQRKLQALSMVSFAFGRNTFTDLDTPCWVTLLNLSALDVLGNERVLQEVKTMAHLNLSDVDDVQLRRNWARLQQHRGNVGSENGYSSDQPAPSAPPQEPQQLNGAPSSQQSGSHNSQRISGAVGNITDSSSNLTKKNWAKLRGRDSNYS